MNGRELMLLRRYPPPGWGRLFAPVPRSIKVRCLLCGATGYGPCGAMGNFAEPAPWQARHIAGHPVRCDVCSRPFVHGGALNAHQNCRLHHACCREHTTVPDWANPFRRDGHSEGAST